MPFPRSSGILLHPTSFPSPFGIGDLGPSAFAFVDFLEESQQKLWQVLPLGTPGYGNSPYLAYSAMAGNPLLISLEDLATQGFLSPEDWDPLPDFPLDTVDFEKAEAVKLPLLRLSHQRFLVQADAEMQAAYQQFCQAQADWLEDYALYMALKTAYPETAWYDWDPALRQRQPQVLAQTRSQLQSEVAFQKYLQFEFDRQWVALRTYANDRNIQIIGDIPIYVAPDSADVWAYPENFCLDAETGTPALMAGVPPDYFSETGQLWGNPVYDWEHLELTGFAWWIRRFRRLLDYVDIIRIDHFRGFQAYWAVPIGEETALNGEWVEAPGEAFFQVLEKELGSLPIVAEDLGIITPEVEGLRDQFGFPGMKILQFAFDSGAENPYLPFNYEGRNWVVYTGTHDNDTTAGWFCNRSEEQQQWVVKHLGCVSTAGIHWDLIRMAFSSVANQAIVPFQDLLGLGSDARMNTPSVAAGNWGWRYRSEALNEMVSGQLKFVTGLTRR